MFKMFIGGRTVDELKDNLRKAFNEFVPDALESEAASLGYADDGDEAEAVVTAAPQPTPTIPSFPVAPEMQGELDVRGVPWNRAVHAETKAKTKDGAWRGRRNGDKEVLTAYESQFLQGRKPVAEVRPAAPAQPAIPQVNHVVSPFTAQPVSFPSQFQQAPQVPQFPTQPPVAAAPQVAEAPKQAAPAYENIPIPEGTKPAHSLATFTNNVVMTMAGLVKAKKINQEYVQQVTAHFGLSNISEISSDPKKTEELFKTLVQYGLITKVD